METPLKGKQIQEKIQGGKETQHPKQVKFGFHKASCDTVGGRDLSWDFGLREVNAFAKRHAERTRSKMVWGEENGDSEEAGS